MVTGEHVTFQANCPGCGEPVTWISRMPPFVSTDKTHPTSDTSPGACATCERNGK